VQLSTGPAPAQDAGSSQGGGTLRTVGFVVAGAGVLALGGGAFMGLSAKSKESEVKDQCKTLLDIGLRCPESKRSEYESAQSNAKLANLLLIGGGVLAAGGVVMIVVGGPSKSDSASSAARGTTLALSPVLGPRDAGLFALGTF
jgi:hypothetical protein